MTWGGRGVSEEVMRRGGATSACGGGGDRGAAGSKARSCRGTVAGNDVQQRMRLHDGRVLRSCAGGPELMQSAQPWMGDSRSKRDADVAMRGRLTC
jgi:hypothetical protein